MIFSIFWINLKTQGSQTVSHIGLRLEYDREQILLRKLERLKSFVPNRFHFTSRQSKAVFQLFFVSSLCSSSYTPKWDSSCICSVAPPRKIQTRFSIFTLFTCFDHVKRVKILYTCHGCLNLHAITKWK